MPPSTATNQKKKQKRKDMFSASRFELDESESASSSGTDVKRVRFERAKPSTSRQTPSLYTRFLPFALPALIIFLCVSIALGSSSPSLSPHIARVIHNATQLFEQFLPPLHPLLPPQPQIPSHFADYVNRAIVAALWSTAERPDFASHGSIIVPSLTVPSDVLDELPSHNPDNVLTADLDRDSCWFFPVSRGQVAIRLPELIHLTHVTIDYLPPEQTLAHHAPRRIVVWGLVDGATNKAIYQRLAPYREASSKLGNAPAHAGAFTYLPFAHFTFNIDMAFPIQTFSSSVEIVLSGITSGLYVVEVQSNWGGNTTGICRVRLHGERSS